MQDYEEDACGQFCEHQHRIQAAGAAALSESEARQVAELFKLLGDATRVKILQALAITELCVCDICATVNMGQSAVSHQLRLLRGARLVKFRRDGKMVWYSLDDDHVNLLLSQGIEHVRHR